MARQDVYKQSRQVSAMSTTMTIRLEDQVKDRLDRLAESTQRSRSFLAAEAIREFVENNEWQVAEMCRPHLPKIVAVLVAGAAAFGEGAPADTATAPGLHDAARHFTKSKPATGAGFD